MGKHSREQSARVDGGIAVKKREKQQPKVSFINDMALKRPSVRETGEEP